MCKGLSDASVVCRNSVGGLGFEIDFPGNFTSFASIHDLQTAIFLIFALCRVHVPYHICVYRYISIASCGEPSGFRADASRKASPHMW